MSEDFDEVLNAALSLSLSARAMLADHLLESLDAENQKTIDALWAEEAERRDKEIEDRVVTPIPGEEVMGRLRARHEKATQQTPATSEETKVIEEALARAAEIRHKLEGRHHSDSTQDVIEDRQR